MADTKERADKTDTRMTPEQAQVDTRATVLPPHADLQKRFGETALIAEGAALLATGLWKQFRDANNEIADAASAPIDAYVRSRRVPDDLLVAYTPHSRPGVETQIPVSADAAATNAIVYFTLLEQKGGIPEAELIRADTLIDLAYGLGGDEAHPVEPDLRLRELVEETVREETARMRIDEAEQTGATVARRHVKFHSAVGEIVDSVAQHGFLHSDIATRALHAIGGRIEQTIGHLPVGHDVVIAAHAVWDAMNNHERDAAAHVAAATDRFIEDQLGAGNYSTGRGNNALYMLRGASKTIQPSELLPSGTDFAMLSRALTVRLFQTMPNMAFAPDANAALLDAATQARVLAMVDYHQGALSLTGPYWEGVREAAASAVTVQANDPGQS